MPKSCPDCGSEVEYASMPAIVLTGTCAECGHPLTVIEPGAAMPSSDAASADGAPAGSAPSASAPVGAALPESFTCAECGESLAIDSATSRELEARCTDCDTTFTFVLKPDNASAPEESDERRRPAWRPERAPGNGPSRARPCRECGAPLRFSTNDEGLVTGECTSCGNRFTLPPRREGSGRPGPRREYGGSSERRGYDRGPPRGGRSFGGDRPRRFNSSAPSFRPRNRWNDDQREAPPRRRRRPSSDS